MKKKKKKKKKKFKLPIKSYKSGKRNYMLVIYNYFGISVSRYRVTNFVYGEGKIFGICENVRDMAACPLINTLLFVL